MTADVGARIRSLRTARGLTQAQLAEPQYTKAYVSMLESGRTRASMKALEHIAGRLGVQPSELLGDAQEQVRIKAALSASYARTYAYEDAIRLLRECVQACDEGVVTDPTFHFRRLSDLAVMLTNQRRPKEAMPIFERAIQMAD